MIFFLLCLLLYGCAEKKVDWVFLSNRDKNLKKVDKLIRWNKLPVLQTKLPDVLYKNKKLYIKEVAIDLDLNKNVIVKDLSDNLYAVGDLSRNFYIISVNGGESKVLYKGVLDSPLGSAARSSNKLVVSSTNGHLKAFNSFDAIWEFKRNSNIGLRNAFKLQNDKIICVFSDGDIAVFDITNGEDLWLYMTSQMIESFDLFASNNHIVVRINEKVVVLDMKGKGSEEEFSGLKQMFFDQKSLIYLIFDNEVLLFDLEGIKKRQFLRSYVADGEFFMENGVLFSLCKNRDLVAYLDTKRFVRNVDAQEEHELRNKITFNKNGMFVL